MADDVIAFRCSSVIYPHLLLSPSHSQNSLSKFSIEGVHVGFLPERFSKSIENNNHSRIIYRNDNIARLVKAWFPLDRNGIVKSYDLSRFWPFVEKLTTVENTNGTVIGSDLQLKSPGAKLRTSLSRMVSAIIQLYTTRTKSPRLTLIKRNSLPNLSRDILA